MDWAGLNGWEKDPIDVHVVLHGEPGHGRSGAVVADEQWRQEVLRLTDIYKHARLRS